MISDAIRYADYTVFPAPIVMQNVLSASKYINRSKLSILPQGRCIPLTAGTDFHVDVDSLRITKLIRPEHIPVATKIVLGMGTVNFRKGVDLFIACAQRMCAIAPDLALRFVWIGKGYDVENDAEYSVYLSDQIERSKIGDRLLIMAEVTDIMTAYLNADLFLLTSRLDPMPNVAIDALSEGLPLLCFDNASGIADVLIKNGLANQYIVPYLDIDAMARRGVEILSTHSNGGIDREKQKTLFRNIFNMKTYVDSLIKIFSEQLGSTKR
jgi:glycosyltransferase involved in cell wall biosynthesis